MFMMVTKQTPARITAAATIATIAETLSTFVLPGTVCDLVPFAEQGVSKGAPQRNGLFENADEPKLWMVGRRGIGPERLLNDRLKCIKFFKSPSEEGIEPESELCDKSRDWSFDRFPRFAGMLPLSWF
ncbi:hypothetical protein L6164_028153 [Bauhinia variegata]|uniref:Uncharacterized protein n=1 Tax=Bauhinia variegata TaxID=167791 RepID=A0ACB9LV75_BAUVA|nr:hypothetical protein L6164_028153 [Bauhinia variegata]